MLLRTDTVPPQIHILFRWDGEQTLYGVRVSVEQDDDEPVVIGTTVAGSLASLITISLRRTCWRMVTASRTRSGSRKAM